MKEDGSYTYTLILLFIYVVYWELRVCSALKLHKMDKNRWRPQKVVTFLNNITPREKKKIKQQLPQ